MSSEKVFVKVFGPSLVEVPFDRHNDTVRSLLNKLLKEEYVNSDDYSLVFPIGEDQRLTRVMMSEERSLHDLGIKSGDVVSLVKRVNRFSNCFPPEDAFKLRETKIN